jgi:hypothetical protein
MKGSCFVFLPSVGFLSVYAPIVFFFFCLKKIIPVRRRSHQRRNTVLTFCGRPLGGRHFSLFPFDNRRQKKKEAKVKNNIYTKSRWVYDYFFFLLLKKMGGDYYCTTVTHRIIV